MRSSLRIAVTIAYNTFRGFSRDRIFHAILFLALAFVLFAYAISTLTIVESQKLLLDFGFLAVSLSGVLVAIFLGISAISREIESKAIYTVLSKPISRVHYLLGKFIGCAAVVAVAHLIMSVTLAAIVAALGIGMPNGLGACFGLMLLESLLILAVAQFSSIFSSSVLATSFTIGMFLIGRSSYMFLAASEKATDSLSKAVLRFLYDVLPNLDRFNIREVTAYSKPYPPGMPLTSAVYCMAYIIFFLALSAFLFRRKEMP